MTIQCNQYPNLSHNLALPQFLAHHNYVDLDPTETPSAVPTSLQAHIDDTYNSKCTHNPMETKCNQSQYPTLMKHTHDATMLDLLQSKSKQWKIDPERWPKLKYGTRQAHAAMALCDDTVVLLGGWFNGSTSKSVIFCGPSMPTRQWKSAPDLK